MEKILFVASEATPFIKTGGLADVIGSLPQSLAKRKHDVRVVIPLYKKISLAKRDKMKLETSFDINVGIIKQTAKIYSTKVHDVIYYFVQNDNYFDRDKLYSYADDGERFAFFQIAVLQMLKKLAFFPDVIHSHDWHTGMIAPLCKIKYQKDQRYQAIKNVFTIHNIAFQGNFPKVVLKDLFEIPDKYYFDGQMRFHDGAISYMKAAIVYADKITTVSETYANEILTSEMGEDLDEILRFRRNDLWGILNGIDTNVWNPETDKYLAKNYNSHAYKASKKACKKALQTEMGLRVSRDTILVGMVSRLTYQKGVYLILEKLQEILGLDIQFVVLGTGEAAVEKAFKEMEYNYKRRAAYYCGYNEKLAHKMYAGCDLLLMPSLFEPCGISQLIAMRYGTLPLVRETGGLKDTVQPYNMYTNEGNGFSFYPFNSHDLWFTLKSAVDTFYLNHDAWDILIKNAMATDVSFEKSTDLYEKLYFSLK